LNRPALWARFGVGLERVGSRKARLRIAGAIVLAPLAGLAGCNLILGNNAGELAPGGVLGGDGGGGGGGGDGPGGNGNDATCCAPDGNGLFDGGGGADGNPNDACGVSCQQAPCDGGACKPVSIATGQTVPFDLAVDGTNAYFTNAGNDGGTGSVAMVPLDGGTVTPLAQGLNRVSDIAIDSANVYWISHDSQQATNGYGDIATVAKTGGSPAFVVQGIDDNLRRFAIYGGNYFWSLDFFAEIYEKVSNQVDPVLLASNVDVIAGMQVDSTGLYAAVGGSGSAGDSVVVSVQFDGGGSVLYSYGATQTLGGLAIDGANVYYTNASDNTVDQVAKSGNPVPPPTVIAQAQNNPSQVAVDGSFVYWTTEGTSAASYMDGTVMKVPIGGGQVYQLAGSQAHPRGIAVDGTNVYWTNMGDGTVMKRPKS
jgi:hypothetical protein